MLNLLPPISAAPVILVALMMM
uniref:Uncharacterized protein n=1 Tax=Arundo donax TaxID=35708 RepID=A0A0A9AQ61_ARUDO